MLNKISEEKNLSYLCMDDVDLHNKRVLIREDFNVPIENGVVKSDARLRAALPTLQKAIAQKAGVIIISHLGRPKEGEFSSAFSLKPVADYLSKLLNHPVHFAQNWLNGVKVEPGGIVLCENVRFNVGEEVNDQRLAQKMAALCDVFIMDAFGTAHRAQASTVGVARFAPVAVAGPLLLAELQPKRPLVAIVGGSKVSTKLEILKFLLNKVDILIVGGGIANTFIAGLGHSIGSTLLEPDLISVAKELMALAEEKGVNLVIPVDVIVAKEINEKADTRVIDFSTDTLFMDEKILDIGPKTIKQYQNLLSEAATILWNGPVGVFEYSPFEQGTRSLAESIAVSSAFSVAGGGETLAAIDKYKVKNNISYVSTGGGAFLECLEGKTLPALKALDQKQTHL
jgi:phosphoglycerate kinase